VASFEDGRQRLVPLLRFVSVTAFDQLVWAFAKDREPRNIAGSADIRVEFCLQTERLRPPPVMSKPGDKGISIWPFLEAVTKFTRRIRVRRCRQQI